MRQSGRSNPNLLLFLLSWWLLVVGDSGSQEWPDIGGASARVLDCESTTQMQDLDSAHVNMSFVAKLLAWERGQWLSNADVLRLR
ncbi:hypothetical protein R3P38DRAFT_2988919, partial [Favolaschia claudopus]